MDRQKNLFESTPPSPLAHRLRPEDWDGFVGQSSAIKKIQALGSSGRSHMVFYGPPGCGKTTLSTIVAKELDRELYRLNAVLDGVKDLKTTIAEIKSQSQFGKQAILFIDEIHRFNKAQQDALLPSLERGDFIFMGATTEYPQTSLNRALLSRVSIIPLSKLSKEDIQSLLTKAQEELGQKFSGPILEEISHYSNGDARVALNAIEALQGKEDLTLEEIQEYFQAQGRYYDKNSDRHYDVISAFIKSLRGSDIDSAMLWLAVMIEGGEDPQFIARRLMIFAAEDIGNASPQALTLATSTHYAMTQLGLPEARIPLAQCVAFLAAAPKSNASYLAIDEALKFVKEHPTAEVPGHLKNHGWEKKNYKYPHAYPNHYIQQEYWATNLPKKDLYQYTGQAFEQNIENNQRERNQG